MAIEIERKYLIKYIPLNQVKYSDKIKQGYIVNDNQKVIRVRKKGDNYFLTIKGNTIGISRSEFEYSIPKKDAEYLFKQFCSSGIIKKTRHYVQNKNHLWEIDEFHGLNNGLLIAEIELSTKSEKFKVPSWIGDEISDKSEYLNFSLAVNPYSLWNQ